MFDLKRFVQLPLLAMLMGGLSTAHASTLDWTNVSTLPSNNNSWETTYTNVDNSGVDITFKIAGDTGRFVSGSPSVNNDGGNLTDDALELNVDYVNGNFQFIFVTYTFSVPVILSTLKIMDIDYHNGSGSNDYNDRVVINAQYDTTSSYAAYGDPDAVITSETVGGQVLKNSAGNYESKQNGQLNSNDTNGHVTLGYTRPIKKLTIKYRNGFGNYKKSPAQEIWIADLVFEKAIVPIAEDDPVATDFNTPVNINALTNDFDPNGDTLSITEIDGTAVVAGDSVQVDGGTATLNADGSITFTPYIDFSDTAFFDYTISDGNGNTATATIAVTVKPVSDTDGDGVDDVDDLDDDNDGILDTEEGYVCSANFVDYTSYSGNLDGITINTNLTGITLSHEGIPGANTALGVYIEKDSAQYANARNDAQHSQIEGDFVINRYSYEFNQPVSDLTLKVTDLDKLTGGQEEYYNVVATYQGNEVAYITETLSAHVSKDNELGYYKDNVSNTSAGPVTLIYQGPVDRIEIIQTTNWGAGGLVGFPEACQSRDTDGDGIPDHRDIDSDNDRCTDANEAYGSTVDADNDGQYDSNGVDSDGKVNGAGYTNLNLSAVTDGSQTCSNPTAVTIGKVELDAQQVSNLFRYLDIDQMTDAQLQALLRAWAPEAVAQGQTREQVLEALRAWLDPDGDGRVAIFSWETLEERGTVGFFAERREPPGDWTRINKRMLPGIITAPLGGQYLLADPKAKAGVPHQYRLIEQEARGSQKTYGPYSLEY